MIVPRAQYLRANPDDPCSVVCGEGVVGLSSTAACGWAGQAKPDPSDRIRSPRRPPRLDSTRRGGTRRARRPASPLMAEQRTAPGYLALATEPLRMRPGRARQRQRRTGPRCTALCAGRWSLVHGAGAQCWRGPQPPLRDRHDGLAVGRRARRSVCGLRMVAIMAVTSVAACPVTTGNIGPRPVPNSCPLRWIAGFGED